MQPLGYIRKLTTALILSGAFNVLLLIFIFYLMLGDRPPIPYCELKPATAQEQLSPLAIDHSNHEVIRYFRKMSFEWLVARLNHAQLVENGYTQRDLALACLVAFHHFDVERALASFPSTGQKRLLNYGKFSDGRPAELTVYLGLSEKQYEAIRSFALTERWPLTTKGLFLTLRKQQAGQREKTLEHAFYMTPEFLVVELLFNRNPVAVDKEELLNMLVEGSWAMLNRFVDQQKVSQDLSSARRQQLLLDYMQAHSKSAARVILKTDGLFAVSKLDDKRVMMLLELLDEKTPESEAFALSLLVSPRSDQVWNLAATRLYQYAGESPPEVEFYHAALRRFVPENSGLLPKEKAPVTVSVVPPIIPPSVKQKETTAKSSSSIQVKSTPVKPKANEVAANKGTKPITEKRDRLYMVQEGDSLWKLSRRFNVNVEELKSYNQLTSPVLRPGSYLKIPYDKDKIK